MGKNYLCFTSVTKWNWHPYLLLLNNKRFQPLSVFFNCLECDQCNVAALNAFVNWRAGLTAELWRHHYDPNLFFKANLHLNANANVACENDANIWCRRITKARQTRSAVQRTFGEQPNTICQLLVLQREFANNTFRYRHTWFIFYIRQCCKFLCTNERTAWEQGLFTASANAEQCTNVPHQIFASFSQATFAFCLHSGVNPALYEATMFGSYFFTRLRSRRVVMRSFVPSFHHTTAGI